MTGAEGNRLSVCDKLPGKVPWYFGTTTARLSLGHFLRRFGRLSHCGRG